MPTNDQNIEERINAAIHAFQSQKNTNRRALAVEFDVPYDRLRRRIQGKGSRSNRAPTNRRLTPTQYEALYLWLDRLDTLDRSATLSELRSTANSILTRNHLDSSLPPPTVGAHWPTNFMKQHPQYFKRKRRTQEVARYDAGQLGELVSWYNRLQIAYDKYQIQEEDLYNFDETGFRIGQGRDQWIITKDASYAGHAPTTSNRDSVTLIEAIAADGHVLPPLIILPGIRHMQSWYEHTELPNDYLVTVSESGYSNDEIALQWLQHFDRYSRKRQRGMHRLLLMDGHKSHLTLEFIEYADSKKIILFCLPEHSTHLMQPLDVVVFQPLKYYHSEAVIQAALSGCNDFNKVEFLASLKDMRNAAFKSSTIRSSFQKTGLWPYNPRIVLDPIEASLPPIPELEFWDGEEEDIIIPIEPTTPHTVRALRRSIINLSTRLPEELSPSTRTQLDRVLKGALVQAELGGQLRQDLDALLRSHRQRQKRSVNTRISLQSGGVIYAKDAVRSIEKKKQDAQQALQTKALKKVAREIKAAATLARKQAREEAKLEKQRLKELQRQPPEVN